MGLKYVVVLVGQSLSSVLVVSLDTYACYNGEPLDITASIGDLGLLPVSGNVPLVVL